MGTIAEQGCSEIAQARGVISRISSGTLAFHDEELRRGVMQDAGANPRVRLLHQRRQRRCQQPQQNGALLGPWRTAQAPARRVGSQVRVNNVVLATIMQTSSCAALGRLAHKVASVQGTLVRFERLRTDLRGGQAVPAGAAWRRGCRRATHWLRRRRSMPRQAQRAQTPVCE